MRHGMCRAGDDHLDGAVEEVAPSDFLATLCRDQ